MRAVQFDRYGGAEVLEVRDVPDPPAPGPGQARVRVRAAGVNPDDVPVREGWLDGLFPVSFPSGQGSDLAGVIEDVGPGVTRMAIGAEVVGFTHDHAAQAELVTVPVHHLVRKPANVSWEAAGGLPLAGLTAWAAVHAVQLRRRETVVVTAAAGGVGSLVVQLARRAGARVVAIAGHHHHSWLREQGATPVEHRGDIAAAVSSAAGGRVDAMVDCYGHGYVQMAIEELGVEPGRVDTVVDMVAAQRLGAQNRGQESASQAHVLDELIHLIGSGELEVPIAAALPLEDVRTAYAVLEEQHTHGKIVLLPSG
ncbi:NADP-dependent oxidoreductase [Isoptericola sp. b441]|uniref:NADP-dependent oxidoreductase n=1 Tax=Actinotalea lenta TaxID=3064654 RepID=A0ABT9D6K4_9CELL|nr:MULTISPECIES: NADP-dependent oxidoreductase [unclassified Isoptericola]MDO8105996.1 NADP-dependent oxidoreductase [Isoptericola sp. b441]MDO8122285.1 NADP-dependent oxidoreductase [Isoptericola sp. b490]